MKATMAKTVSGCRVSLEAESGSICKYLTNLEGRLVSGWWRFENGWATVKDVCEALRDEGYEVIFHDETHGEG